MSKFSAKCGAAWRVIKEPNAIVVTDHSVLVSLKGETSKVLTNFTKAAETIGDAIEQAIELGKAEKREANKKKKGASSGGNNTGRKKGSSKK